MVVVLLLLLLPLRAPNQSPWWLAATSLTRIQSQTLTSRLPSVDDRLLAAVPGAQTRIPRRPCRRLPRGVRRLPAGLMVLWLWTALSLQVHRTAPLPLLVVAAAAAAAAAAAVVVVVVATDPSLSRALAAAQLLLWSPAVSCASAW